MIEIIMAILEIIIIPALVVSKQFYGDIFKEL